MNTSRPVTALQRAAWMAALVSLTAGYPRPAVSGVYDLPEEPGRPDARASAGVSGKLIGTGGVTQLEGAAGGGIVPWALTAGYGTRDQIGAAAFYTHLNLNDYRLNAAGAAVTVFDRLELSYAHQAFQLTGTVFPGNTIKVEVLGGKVRLWGDAVFAQDSHLPQVAVGIQHKRNKDFDFIPRAVGAKGDSGTDYYLAATKLYLGPLGGRNLLLNGTIRATKANQIGLLGFGGDRNDIYRLHIESSAAIFLDDRTVFGCEYRSKPDNLSAAREEDWGDLFLAYFPSKSLAWTVAYAKLGKIAGKDQNGLYLSLQTGF